MKSLQVQSTKLMELALAKLNNEEKRLVHIESDKDIFKNYDEDKKKNLAKKLVTLSFFVGIKEPLSIEELKMIVHFLCRQFPYCTIPKLEDAFMKAAAGELGENEHYQSFSPQYIAKTIRSYENISKAAMKKYFQEREKQELEDLSNQRAKNYDPIQGCIDILKTEYQRHRAKKIEQFNVMDVYLSRWAIQAGLKLGLFNDFNADEITEERYLRQLFVRLFKANADMNSAIEQYVYTNEKNKSNKQNNHGK
jgi:hypothetical protein